MNATRTLLVFARVPERGLVKTRLALELGQEAALGIYLRMAEQVIASVRTSDMYETVICYTPAHDELAMRAWLGSDLKLLPQRGENLGLRMREAIEEVKRGGAGQVVVIGTDCPAVESQTVVHAFSALETADLVLGPAHDGGYYLIGVHRAHAVLFSGIPWSSPDTLRQTMVAADANGLRTVLLAPQRDVDTAGDWAAVAHLVRPA